MNLIGAEILSLYFFNVSICLTLRIKTRQVGLIEFMHFSEFFGMWVFFWDFRKNDPRPKWTIYKHISNKSVCVLVSAYTSLCRGLKYLINIRYIILVDSNGARFLIFKTVFLGRSATLSYMSENTSQKWVAFAFVSTYLQHKLSQNMCLINTHILIYWHVRCDCKLSNVLFYINIFMGIFHTYLTTIYIWIAVLLTFIQVLWAKSK